MFAMQQSAASIQTLDLTRLSHRPVPWMTLLLAGASLLIALIPGASNLLQYERSAMTLEQCWRPLTCHLTHWPGNHLFWDVVMFITLGAIAESCNQKAFVLALALSAGMIPLVLLLALPELETYRGLSGIDSALTGLIAVTVLAEYRKGSKRSHEQIIALAVLAGLGLKMIYEAITGSAVFVPSATEASVPLAHLTGAICGATSALIIVHKKNRAQRT